MSGSRCLLGLVALAPLSVGLLAGCSDDDTAAPATPESTTTTEAPTTTSTTTTVPDSPAEEPPPDQSAEDEGLGDTLAYVADVAQLDEDGAAAEAQGRVEVRPDDDTLCFDVAVTGFDGGIEVVHVRNATDDADPVVTVDRPAGAVEDDARWLDACHDVDPAVAGALADDPGAFTVDVAVDGEARPLRGQFRPATIFDLELS